MQIWSVILGGALLGIGGSLHCVGMCGPLIMSLPFSHLQSWERGKAIAAYFVSKALIYGLLGLVFGMIGKAISMVNLQQKLSILLGIMLIVMILIPAWSKQWKFLDKLQNRVVNGIQQAIKMHGIGAFFVLGGLNALLPCGLVYTALAASMATATATFGFVFMFVFGLVSALPLVGLSAFGSFMNVKNRKYFRLSTNVITIFVGVLLILRGMNLGIPFLSPAMGADGHVAKCCSH